MQTWRSTRSGMRPLGSGIDKDGDVTGSRAMATRAGDDNSTDNILEPAGIVKTTDVVVTRYQAKSNGDLESLADSGVGRSDHY